MKIPRLPIRCLVRFFVAGFSLITAIPSGAATFTVLNNNDAGAGSLRQAVASAQNAAGEDMIVFQLPPGQTTIGITSDIFVRGALNIVNDRPGDVPVNLQVVKSSLVEISAFYIVDNAKAFISGLTITGGTFAGIRNQNGELTMRNCTLTENTGSGGTIDNSGKVILTNCTLSKSSAGTIRNRGGEVAVAACNFTGNSANDGAAIHSTGGGLTVRDCTFADNVARATTSQGGGAILSRSEYLVVVNCTFERNISKSDGGGGGAIFGAGGAVLIANCTFVENAAKRGGAFFDYGSATGRATFVNCTFSGNSAEFGGAVYVENYYGQRGSKVAINNCTFSGNFMLPSPITGVTYDGGAIMSGNAGRVEIANSLFRRANSGGNLSTSYQTGGTIISFGHNLTDDAAGGDGGTGPGGLLNGPGDIRNTDPRLGSLADNGGPTQTCAVLTGSPAINSGDDARTPPRDQRGFTREGISDIGSFESGGRVALSRLVNISTRLRVGVGDDALISGFIITGTDPKKVLVRATGSSLSSPLRLQNPMAELHGSSGALASNDNWGDAPNRQEIEETGIAPTHTQESAILTVLEPGAYTAVVRGANNTEGIGLAEVYELDSAAEPQFGNISTRGRVLTGDNVMIGGFIVQGPDNHRVLIRALGPSLNLSKTLGDPSLALHDSNGSLLAANAGWRESVDSILAVAATGLAPGSGLEPALAVTVPPGQYTAIVSGSEETSGIALIEIYGLK